MRSSGKSVFDLLASANGLSTFEKSVVIGGGAGDLCEDRNCGYTLAETMTHHCNGSKPEDCWEGPFPDGTYCLHCCEGGSNCGQG